MNKTSPSDISQFSCQTINLLILVMLFNSITINKIILFLGLWDGIVL